MYDDAEGWAGEEFARDDRCYCSGCESQGLWGCSGIYARQEVHA